MVHRKVRTHDTSEEAKVEVFEGLIFESLGSWMFFYLIRTYSANFQGVAFRWKVDMSLCMAIAISIVSPAHN